MEEVELAKFYAALLASEARHFEHYLGLAKQYSHEAFSEDAFKDRVQFFLREEAQLIRSVDDAFHFHSGVPV